MNDLIIGEKNNQNNLFVKISISLYLMIVYFSYFTSLVSTYFGGIVVYFIYFLPVFFILAIRINVRIKKADAKLLYSKMVFWFLTFFTIYYFLFQIVSSKYLAKEFFGLSLEVTVFNLAAIIPVLIISNYLLSTKAYKFKFKVLIMTLIILVINIIFTLRLIIQDPNSSKILATIEGMSIYGLTGASGYNITYSAVLLIPVFLYGINKFRNLKRILWYFLTFISFIFIYKSAYTLAILATALAVLLYAFFSLRKIYRIIIIIPCIIIIYFAFNTDGFYQILLVLSRSIDIYEVSQRFRDLANLIKFGDTSAISLSRLDLYANSLNAFFKSPFIGIFPLESSYRLSNHSTVLDVLGGTGLIGFIPFVLSFYYSFKKSLSYVGNTNYKKCIYTSYLVFIFIAFLNPIFNSPTITFTLLALLPLFSHLFRQNNLKTLSNSVSI